MGAPLPARIQPGSIDHVPFPTVGTCLGASLALREKARRVAWSESVAGCLDMQPSLGQRNPGFLGSAASTRSNATAGLGSFRACRGRESNSTVTVSSIALSKLCFGYPRAGFLASTGLSEAERMVDNLSAGDESEGFIHESGLEELEGIGFNPATVQYETMECNGIDGRGLPAPKSDASLVPLSIGTSWHTI
ncbi:hypothetical protein Tco_1385177 [Tanacetum coccineum]